MDSMNLVTMCLSANGGNTTDRISIIISVIGLVISTILTICIINESYKNSKKNQELMSMVEDRQAKDTALQIKLTQ